MKTRNLDIGKSDVPFYNVGHEIGLDSQLQPCLFQPFFLTFTREWLLDIEQMPLMHEHDVPEIFSVAPLIAMFYQHHSTFNYEQFRIEFFGKYIHPNNSLFISQATKCHLILIEITKGFLRQYALFFSSKLFSKFYSKVAFVVRSSSIFHELNRCIRICLTGKQLRKN